MSAATEDFSDGTLMTYSELLRHWSQKYDAFLLHASPDLYCVCHMFVSLLVRGVLPFDLFTVVSREKCICLPCPGLPPDRNISKFVDICVRNAPQLGRAHRWRAPEQGTLSQHTRPFKSRYGFRFTARHMYRVVELSYKLRNNEDMVEVANAALNFALPEDITAEDDDE